MVCSRGKFHLADKAPAMNCVVGFGGLFGDRPIFSWGNFFKAVYAESWFSPGKYRVLFQDRQRLQIAMGDSNMCETAEFLRVGTTCLVLDAIESGWIVDAPRLKSPIQALRAICADPTLSVKVELVGGQRATALQIQRYYLEQVRGFLEDREAVPAEARQIVACWKQVLDDLEEVGPEREPPDQLVGQLDWVTKKYLLDHAAPRASWAERKKIDICYHELSSHGYYNMLAESELACPILDDVEIERAMRSAPADTPATTRGHYIREFARGDQPVAANWHSVFIGSGWDTRVIRLSRFGQGRSDSQPPAAETEKV